MSAAAIAAMFLETETTVSRDMDEDTVLEVAGLVAWCPEREEWIVSGVRCTRILTWVPDGDRPDSGDYEATGPGGYFANEREEQRAKEALISAAESEGVGRCVACVHELRANMADGADCLCREHRERFQRRAA